MDSENLLLENICAVFLYKKFGDNLFYYKQNAEVDFYVPDLDLGIQVAYDIDDEGTRKREVNALAKLNEIAKLNKALIITKNTEEKISVGELEIDVVPVWKWILLY